MSSKRHIAKINSEVTEDLMEHGMAQVRVEIDEKKIAYISGVVESRDAEADAVAVVLEHDVDQVQDGLQRPGLIPPNLERTGALGPRSYSQSTTHAGRRAR